MTGDFPSTQHQFSLEGGVFQLHIRKSDSTLLGPDSSFCAGLWLNIPDYDAPTQMVKPHERNTCYVDAVLTIPKVLIKLLDIILLNKPLLYGGFLSLSRHKN